MLRVSVAPNYISLAPFATFNPKMGYQFSGLINIQPSLSNIILQKAAQHFIYPAYSRPYAYKPGKGKQEPKRLKRLPEILGRR